MKYKNYKNELIDKNCIISNMIKEFLIKYYTGAFSIKCEKNPELEDSLNYLLYRFFQTGKSACLLKIAGLEKLIVGNPISVLRSSNFEPFEISVSYKKNNLIENLIFSDILEKSNLNLKNIALLEFQGGENIWTYITPLLLLAETQFTTLLRSLTNANLKNIYFADKKNFDKIKKFLHQLYYDPTGLFAVFEKEDEAPIDEFKIQKNNNSTGEYKDILENFITTLNLIKQFMGVRHNENFKLEKNISFEFLQSNIIFNIFERNIEKAINKFLRIIKEKFNIKAKLITHTNYKIDNVTQETSQVNDDEDVEDQLSPGEALIEERKKMKNGILEGDNENENN